MYPYMYMYVYMLYEYIHLGMCIDRHAPVCMCMHI